MNKSYSRVLQGLSNLHHIAVHDSFDASKIPRIHAWIQTCNRIIRLALLRCISYFSFFLTEATHFVPIIS